jgi:putative ABC transport system substrate-binding protein
MRVLSLGLIVLLAFVLIAAPLAAEAQAGKIYRIGVLLYSDPKDFKIRFGEGLQELGYREGHNILVDYRSAPAGQADRLVDLAAELVRLKVDVVVAYTTVSTQAAKRATAEIPIIMIAPDPVGTGLIATLARPGANVTGLSSTVGDLGGKHLQLLRECLPGTTRVAALAIAGAPFTRPFMEQIQSAARSVGVQIQPIGARGADDLDGAFSAMVKERTRAVIIVPVLATRHAAGLAVRHRLASLAGTTSFAAVGGLMSYAARDEYLYRRAATYVDKILKGAKPADLPVEQPTKFELVINMKTAKALGLTIPPALLLRADQVIE